MPQSPFNETLLSRMAGAHPTFAAAIATLTQPDKVTIGRIINRAKRQVEDFQREMKSKAFDETDWVTFGMDLIVVHYLRRLKLVQLMLCDESDFRQELARIHFSINRVDITFPNDVRLRFAEVNPSEV